MSGKTITAVSGEQIGQMVLQLRGHKVMLDADLATLYGVPTKALNQAVQRNIERFPDDFMFQLTREEMECLASVLSIDNSEYSRLRSQFVTLKTGRGQHRKYLPYAFAEQGVAMLSSVLRSPQAVQVNIAIMRAFVSLRGMMRSQDSIKHELELLRRQYKDHDDQIKAIFMMIDEIMAPPPLPKKRRIGYIQSGE